MTTKKEILDCVKSIAKNQDLIATNQNTERKAEAITTQKLLAEIFKELHSIRTILENAAKEPEPVKEDKPLADIFEQDAKKPEVDLEKEIKKHTDLFQADIEYPLRLTAIKFYELGKSRSL